MIIAIDFDGTVVKHKFPKVGEDIGAVPVLKELIAKGHKLILNTMRSDIVNPKGRDEDTDIHLESGTYLQDALDWFKMHDIELYGIHKNPTQHTWTLSPKCYAELYIDDAALGCPLQVDTYFDGDKLIHEGRPYANWVKIREMLLSNGLI